MDFFKEESHIITAYELRKMYLPNEKRISKDIIDNIIDHSIRGIFSLKYNIGSIENKRYIKKEAKTDMFIDPFDPFVTFVDFSPKPLDDKFIKFNKDIEKLYKFAENIIDELRLKLSEDIDIDILYNFYAKEAYEAAAYQTACYASTGSSIEFKEEFSIDAFATETSKIKDILNRKYNEQYYYYDTITVKLYIKWI